MVRLHSCRPVTIGERFLAAAPISALAGWITAATIVNVASALDGAGIQPGDQAVPLAAAAVAVGGLAAVAALALNGGIPWYAVAFCWALVGIAIGHEARGPAPLLAGVCVIGVSAVLTVTILKLRKPGNFTAWFGGGEPAAWRRVIKENQQQTRNG